MGAYVDRINLSDLLKVYTDTVKKLVQKRLRKEDISHLTTQEHLAIKKFRDARQGEVVRRINRSKHSCLKKEVQTAVNHLIKLPVKDN